MEEYNISELVSNLDFKKNSLVKCSNGIYLTNFEISIMNKYNIKYNRCKSLKEILFYIEEILDEDNTLDDLEQISKSISERDYYLNSHK